jgi:hypothetical protein
MEHQQTILRAKRAPGPKAENVSRLDTVNAVTFADDRPGAVALRKLSDALHDSPRLAAQRKLADALQDSARMAGVEVLHHGPSPVQRRKGDPGDPHLAAGSEPVRLPEVTDAVLVPGLAGCAAIKINVFQTGGEERRLVQSIVFHSEGKVQRSMDAAGLINRDIIGLKRESPISVEILTIYNGKHDIARQDHAPVMAAITQDFEGNQIPYSEREEVIKSDDDFIDVDMSGTTQEILERYHGQLRVPASPEVRAYRMARFVENRNRMAKSGVTQEKLDNWVARWGRTETIDQVDELIQEATRGPEKKEERGGCYLTSACVAYAGLADDCHELATLRAFRDRHLRQSATGRRLIDEYYAVAPSIVAAIEQSRRRARLYAGILRTVRACVAAIEQTQSDKAQRLYVNMVKRLQEQLLA